MTVNGGSSIYNRVGRSKRTLYIKGPAGEQHPARVMKVRDSTQVSR